MTHTVVFLWISVSVAVPLAPGAPLAGERLADLRDFGAARGLVFAPAALGSGAGAVSRADRPLGLPAYDAARSDSLEAELEQARTDLSTLAEAAAIERLARVEAELTAHPYLPQAPFLMAECFDLQAKTKLVAEPARARELEARREALEGPRAASFGDALEAARPARSPVPLSLEGLSRQDTLVLDGSASQVATTVLPGIHHARVERAGHPIFATFFEVGPEGTKLRLPVPQIAPCSADALSEVRLDVPQGAHVLAEGVSCPNWAIVRGAPQGIAVALCERSHCGSFVPWQKRTPSPFFALPAVERSPLPAWAGFSIAGAAVVLTTSLVLWQTGALEGNGRSSPTWEYGGLKPQSFRF